MGRREDARDAVQALQEGGYPPIAAAVGWLVGMAPQQASRALVELARRGEVAVAGTVPSAGGRPARYYHLARGLPRPD